MLFIDFSGIWQLAKRKWWPLESLVDQLTRKTGIQLGYTGPLLLRRNHHLRGSALFWHKQVMGNTGSGKSELLKQLVRQFIARDIPFCLIDPHSDLAESMLSYLLESGYFERPDVAKNPMKKLLYIDFGIKDARRVLSASRGLTGRHPVKLPLRVCPARRNGPRGLDWTPLSAGVPLWS